ncbi:heme exporter protein B [Desulfovibrionales bacterium]
MILRPTLAIAGKDLHLVALRGAGLVQALLLGLLLLFLFSLTTDPGQWINPQAAAAIFWLASIFCQVLIFNSLYGIEEPNAARLTLLLAPIPHHAVWLGKTMAGAILMVAVQIVLLPAMLILLGQRLKGPAFFGLGVIALIDLGLVTMGSFMGALAQGQAARESMFSVILFPILIPLLLAGVRLGAATLGAPTNGLEAWVGLAAAFDALSCGVGLLLFSFVYNSED